MKKIFYCFIILLLFSLFVFWTGWTQVKIKPECTGIVVSKTSGISSEPVLPGIFSWYWEFLLPTNANLISFDINPLNTEKNITNQLPLSDSSNEFSYSFDFAVSLTVLPDELIALYSQNKISCNEDLSAYLDNAASAFAQMAAAYYIKKYEENPGFHPESVRREDLLRSMKAYESYPDVEILTFALTSWKFPDFELYEKYRTSKFQKSETNTTADQPEETEGI